MAKAVTIEMNAIRLNGALLQLSKLTGKDLRPVVRVETQKVLETSLKFTPAAKPSDIKQNADKFEFVTASADMYAPKKPRSAARYQGFLPKKNKSSIERVVYYRFNKYPAELWAQITELKKKRLVRRLMARGLLKKSWIQVAEKIGLALTNVPKYVRDANFNGIDFNGDTKGGERGTVDFQIWGIIKRVYDSRIVSALSRAMSGRVKYFEKNLKLGVFKKAEDIAKKYPGLYVNG